MRIDYQVTRELTSTIPDRVSTAQIKAGLQKIKKAQEQVLEQLKKNHPDYSIDVRQTNSQINQQKRTENELLKQELNIQRERSTQKSTLYRRRVVDLESSLAMHEKNQSKLKADNKILEDQFNSLQQRYQQLERDYEKLMGESEKSGKNLRNLQRQIVQLNKRLQDDNAQKLKTQFDILAAQRNQLKSQKLDLLKNYSRLESQNIELKMKTQGVNKQRYRSGQISKILLQINRMNSAHQYLFGQLKSNKKLSKTEIDKQNSYQNSLNQILQMLGSMQLGEDVAGSEGVLTYKFDQEESIKQEMKKLETQLMKKHKKQLLKYATEKEDLASKNKIKDKRLQEIQTQNRELELKLDQIRKQKTQYMQEITQLTNQISALKANKQNIDRERTGQEIKRQKSKDEEYRSIILELNEQMLTIQKQKKDLDGLLAIMTNNKSEQESKNKKKLSQIAQINQQIKQQNQKIKQKYEAILIEKEHLYLSLTQCQNRNTSLGKQLAREVMQKEKLISQLNKQRQEKELKLVEVQKYKVLSEANKKQIQNVGNSYMIEIQRLTQQNIGIRNQLGLLIKDRNELRDMRAKYELLLKDNQILGKKAKYTNSQIDHLWTIKEVQYQNINRVLNEFRPQFND